MEYMAAGSLKQIIDKCKVFKEEVTIRYIGQILEGLAYIHNIGIVHCDLKCVLANFLLLLIALRLSDLPEAEFTGNFVIFQI